MNDGSCNHMTCAVCAAEFCWLCMKEISDLHYLRYKIKNSCVLFAFVCVCVCVCMFCFLLFFVTFSW
jgi:hypothetical protein